MSEEKSKAMLTIRIDRRAMDCLNRIAEADNSSDAAVMVRFFESLQYSVALVDADHRGDLSTIRDGMAGLLLAEMPHASPEALRFGASIWERAAQLRAQQGGEKQ